MNEELSRRIALRLIAALSAEDVHEVLKDEEASFYFDDPQHWTPYGEQESNWDRVGNQQTNPIGALVELVTNGIDSILLRKARDAGIEDFRGKDAPQSMTAAVKRFFPTVLEGKIGLLESAQRAALAKQCIKVAIQRPFRKNHPYPSYTVVDHGEGQLPENFPNTFLSLGKKNKEGIHFVQGKFNMGGTGSLRFCTRSDIRLGHFKLIVSRRPGQPYWGWTLVRVRGPRENEELPVAEYFHVNQRAIPKFRANSINAFGHQSIGVIEEGSIIKLYEYDIGPEARAVDFGLYNALTVNLIECALPVQLYDFNAQPVTGKGEERREGIAPRTFGGMNVVLRADAAPDPDDTSAPGATGNTEWQHLIADIRDEELGRVRIIGTAVSRLQDFLANQPARVFYTINGQTHAIERASFLNTRVGLPDLRNHLLVNVVCDELNKLALPTIFMPDRESMASNDLSRLLQRKVIDELKADEKLRAYAAEIRRRRATEYSENKDEDAELLKDLAKADPAIRDLFGLGTFLPDVSTDRGGDEPFKGKKFPTFLKPLNLRMEGGKFVKELPVRGHRRIECGTDAADDYLTRIDSPGDSWCSLDVKAMPHTVKLRNGTARFTLYAPKAAKPGDSVEVEFGFVDIGPNLEPLKFAVVIRFTEEEEADVRPSGKKSATKPETKPAVGEPSFVWVKEAGWSEHNFDDTAGAYVSTGEQTTVYVNHDNKFLKAMRMRQKDDAQRVFDETVFRRGLGLLALALHKKATAPSGESEERKDDPEQFTRMATSAMAPYVVTIIQRLGGADARAR